MACVRCGQEGTEHPGPPRAALYFYARSAIWALHKMRQLYDGMGRHDRAAHMSAIIREFESVIEDTNPSDD